MRSEVTAERRGAGSDELIVDDGVLNFETQSSYQVIVEVTDSGGNTGDNDKGGGCSDSLRPYAAHWTSELGKRVLFAQTELSK